MERSGLTPSHVACLASGVAQPNILLLVADDHRASAMSCFDGPTRDAVETPNLDRLANGGTRYRQAYHAGSPVPAVCAPSRAMLHTGCDPRKLPPDMVGGLPGEFTGKPSGATLGSLLGDAGYRTHHVGKWHNGDAAFERSFQTGRCVFMGGMADHFDTPLKAWDGRDYCGEYMSGAHSSDVFSEAARLFLNTREDDRPFFLSVAFTAPHDPRRTHAEYHDRFPPESIALPPNFTPTPDLRPDRLPIRDNLCLPIPRDPRGVQREIAGYYAMVEHLDHCVGRVLEVVPENTLVVYTADHGHALGQHGLFAKQNVYDHSVRVPLIVSGPGVDVGVSDRLVYQHDLFPTLLERAGVEVPASAFRSLDTSPPREAIGCYYEHECRMTTDGRHKTIENLLDGTTRRYDLAADPWEMQPTRP